MAKQQTQPKTVNDRADDPDARPMLYDPLQGGQTRKSTQYIATAIVCLGAAAAGTGLSWTSPVMDQFTKQGKFNTPISVDEGSWIASLLAIGAIVGAVPCGILADKIGRKKAAIFLTVPYIISWFATVFATSLPMLYFARFLLGIAVGGSCVVCPVYISEYAETAIRGTLGTCFQLFLTIGILFVFACGALQLNWVLLSWLCLVFPILNLIGLCFLPESPVWLLKNRRDTEAATAIKWFWGRFCDSNKAIQAIKHEMDSAGNSEGGIRDLFAVSANRKGFIICVLLMFFQQFSGINAVIFFAQPIFVAAGSTISPPICTLIIGIVQVLMTFASAVLIEKAGRKVLLIFSSTVMCICLVALGIYFHLKTKQDVSNIGFIPLVSLIGFIISFSLGYGPIPWMMMGEMLAPEIKGIASSLTVEFNWISVFIITKSFEPLKNTIGDASTFWVFGVIMAVATSYVIICLFETKGKSNTEIQMKLAGGK